MTQRPPRATDTSTKLPRSTTTWPSIRARGSTAPLPATVGAGRHDDGDGEGEEGRWPAGHDVPDITRPAGAPAARLWPGGADAAMLPPVTLEEGLAELGIDASASREAARRAYLRGLKSRSPERDPDGFKRLRVAYELVGALIRAGLLEAAPEPTQAASADPAPARILVEVKDAHDGPTRAGDAPPGAADAADAADADAATDEPDEPDDCGGLADVDARRVWASLAGAFDAAAAHVDADAPPIVVAVDVCLRLVQIGDLEGAAALSRSVDCWLAVHGGGARLVAPALAAVWSLVRELCVVAGDLEPTSRAILALALRQRDLGSARPGLRETAGELWALRDQAPLLAQALRMPEPVPEPRERRTHFGGAAFALFLLLSMLGRGAMNLGGGTPSVPVERAPRARPALGASGRYAPGFRDVVLAARGLTDVPIVADDVELLAVAAGIAFACDRSDCRQLGAEAMRARRIVDGRLAGQASAELEAAAVKLEASVRSACPETRPPP
jgi:hypothetical protein